MKYQVLFSLKANDKLFKTVVCCSRDWNSGVSLQCFISVFLQYVSPAT